MRSFHRYTNLHEFIREIATDILTEEVEQEDERCRYLRTFLTTFNVSFPADAFESEDTFWRFTSESDRYHDALDELTEEVFHVLFNDLSFLQAFNQLCADYIESSNGFGDELKTRTGCLKRVRIPKWARRAPSSESTLLGYISSWRKLKRTFLMSETGQEHPVVRVFR